MELLVGFVETFNISTMSMCVTIKSDYQEEKMKMQTC